MTHGADSVRRVVAGGATRAASVRAGLVAVPDDAAIIVVHDAARPLASAGLFRGGGRRRGPRGPTGPCRWCR